MGVKQVVQIIVVLTFVGLAGLFLFSPGCVDFDPPAQHEVEHAMALLRSSLPNPRHNYVDFVAEHAGIQGDTPPFAATFYPVYNGEYSYIVNVPNSGLYSFALEYALPQYAFNNIILSVLVNDEQQYEEASNIILPVFWEDESKMFTLNRFGDETPPMRTQMPGLHRVHLFNAAFTSDTPLLFYLTAGENIIQISRETTADVELLGLTVYSEKLLPLHQPPSMATYSGLIAVPSIGYTRINSPLITVDGERNPALQPFHPVDRRMNIVSMNQVGNEIFLDVDIAQDGYYAVTLHAITGLLDINTFVTLRVNGEIPFHEAASHPLVPETSWGIYTLTDSYGNPLYVYFEAGTHEISLRVDTWPFAEQINQLQLLIDHINHFSLDVRRITGRQVDRNRTWRITQYLTNTDAYLAAYETLFHDLITTLGEHSPHHENSSISSDLTTGIILLQRLRQHPDELPLYMDLLNGTGASVLQMAGIVLDTLISPGVTINNVYLGRSYNLPRATASPWQRFSAGTQNLWASYTSGRFDVHTGEGLTVWVNHSYLHVDLLQRMIDTRFTPETGIQVNVSVMPDVHRLIMARAAGTHPDVALGVPAGMPFELGARGALYDLTQFDDFWCFMGNLVPGALVPYIFNDAVFALPETVAFNATVYRTDILGPLNMTAPDTWEDVAAMQSELQRFDMSFFMPIAAGTGYKWFFQTSPLIYQNNGLLFNPNGLSTAIDEPQAVEALTLLGDLFTTFALSEQVPSFFNSFRFGQTPVGIIDSGTYMLLQRAAPELLGQWALAPFPGTRQPDDSVSRWFIANGAGAFIFDDTPYAGDAWEFLKWYLSAEVQADFALTLFSNFNILWLSSNLEALSQAPIEHSHMEIIMDSMEWLRDVPRSLGQYMLERRLSDIWNTMVFEGTPAQIAIDLRVIDINREFRRKMTEFGFLDATGNQVQPYVVRELDWVIHMINTGGVGRD